MNRVELERRRRENSQSKPPLGSRAKRAAADTAEKAQSLFGDMREYLGGKPTAMELSNQFGFALEGERIKELALRALPATAAVGSVLGLGNIMLGDDSFANKGMDLLGMGGGMYGMAHMPYGVGGTTNAGRALRYTGGAMAGKLGSDLIQYLGGGGQSTTDRQILEALENLGGGRG